MSAHCEKNSKDKHSFIDRIGRDPRRLQLLFQSDADKSIAEPATRGRAIGHFLPPEIFKNIFNC